MKRHLILPLLLLCSLTAGAQRTSDGERLLSLSGISTLSHWGGEVVYGRYFLRGYWIAGAALTDRVERDVPSGETVHYPRLEGRGGCLYRLAGGYSRRLNLYVGGDAFVGVEMLDLHGILSETTLRTLHNGGVNDYQFIYGAAPRVELELFLLRTLALTAGGRAPLTFGSPLPLLGWEVSAGLRLNF